jgi:hypothetical protein
MNVHSHLNSLWEAKKILSKLDADFKLRDQNLHIQPCIHCRVTISYVIGSSVVQHGGKNTRVGLRGLSNAIWKFFDFGGNDIYSSLMRLYSHCSGGHFRLAYYRSSLDFRHGGRRVSWHILSSKMLLIESELLRLYASFRGQAF